MVQLDLFSHLDDDGDNEPEQQILTVSEVTEQIKDLLESSFPNVWIAGEISNYSQPRSGHCYLTLKDDEAQLPAVIWRSTVSRLRFQLHDGLEVVCLGHLDVYPPRGRYQLIVRQIEPKGIGALELAFRQLRDKLAKEGLFEPGFKKPLPRFSRRIAVITSPTGAAIRDFLEVLRRRWRGTDVWIVPVRVQGEGAAEEIAAAIEQVNRLAEPPDSIVVTRGGGSLEDLWAFNEEIVVRAIFASQVPVVSAIGHEIDVTLSDLVADVRALTPSEAAELVAPAAEEVVARLGQIGRQMAAALRGRVVGVRQRLDRTARHRLFRRPLDLVFQRSQRLDDLEARQNRAAAHRIEAARAKLESMAARLDSLSPLAVLGRGYSITERTATSELIRSADQVAAGEQIRTRLVHGSLLSRVEDTSL
ncbi:MAG: exodeoxyribonuclease VII large subunit [Thermoguttaceae bacterium]